MQLISSRNVPFIDSQTLELGHAKEALFATRPEVLSFTCQMVSHPQTATNALSFSASERL